MVLGGTGVDMDLQGTRGYSGHQRLTVPCSFLRGYGRVPADQAPADQAWAGQAWAGQGGRPA